MMNRESIKSICVGKDIFFRSNTIPNVYVHSFYKDDENYVEVVDESSTYMMEYKTLRKTRNIFDFIFGLLRFILPTVLIVIGIKDWSFKPLMIGLFMLLPHFTKAWNTLYKVINLIFRRKVLTYEYLLQDTFNAFRVIDDRHWRIPTLEEVKNAPSSNKYSEDIDGFFYLVNYLLIDADILFIYPDMPRFWGLLVAIVLLCLLLSYGGYLDKLQSLIYQRPNEKSYDQIAACMRAWMQLEESFEKMQREQGYCAIIFEVPEDENNEEKTQNQDQDGKTSEDKKEE